MIARTETAFACARRVRPLTLDVFNLLLNNIFLLQSKSDKVSPLSPLPASQERGA